MEWKNIPAHVIRRDVNSMRRRNLEVIRQIAVIADINTIYIIFQQIITSKETLWFIVYFVSILTPSEHWRAASF